MSYPITARELHNSFQEFCCAQTKLLPLSSRTSQAAQQDSCQKVYNINEQLDCQVADRAHDNVLDGNSPNVDDEAYLILTFVDSTRNSLWSDVTTVDAEQSIIHNTHFVCPEFCVTRSIHSMLMSHSLTKEHA
jgi:hypothetical protein